jgi:hypothetical protein
VITSPVHSWPTQVKDSESEKFRKWALQFPVHSGVLNRPEMAVHDSESYNTDAIKCTQMSRVLMFWHAA